MGAAAIPVFVVHLRLRFVRSRILSVECFGRIGSHEDPVGLGVAPPVGLWVFAGWQAVADLSDVSAFAVFGPSVRSAWLCGFLAVSPDV